MTVDGSRLRIVARGNRRHGYAGTVIIEDGPIPWEWTCPHDAHSETAEARSCARRSIRAGLVLLAATGRVIAAEIVTNVGPDQQDQAHDLAKDHAQRVVESMKTKRPRRRLD